MNRSSFLPVDPYVVDAAELFREAALTCGESSEANLVTAWWPFQFDQNNWTMTEFGLEDPSGRALVVDDWDGVAWFRD